MGIAGFTWGAFCVDVGALIQMVGGGFYGLIESGHPAFLAPILMGLFFFYLAWEAVTEDENELPPQPPQKQS